MNNDWNGWTFGKGLGYRTLKKTETTHNCLNCTSRTIEIETPNIIYCTRSGKVIADSMEIEEGNTEICIMFNEEEHEKSISDDQEEDTNVLPF